ncbi:MAG: MFS transporter [Moraxellaceae bacterium]|nr:MFS transporter [Moraxellaceae bacterium]
MQLSRNQVQLFSLIAVSMLAHVTMGGGRITASLFMLKHNNSQLLAGLAYSAYSVLPVLLSLAMGKWIDRVGARYVMRVSQALMVVGLAVPAVVPGPWVVMLTSMICGLGFASYLLAANVAVSLMPFEHHGERVGMLGWLAMGNSVAAVGGPAIAGLMIDWSGFRAAYLALALIVAASLVVSFCVDVPGGAGAPRKDKAKGDSVVRMVFSDPALLRIYLLAMGISVSFDCFSFMTPVLGHERGFSATTIGMIMSAFAVGSFAVRALLPLLSRHMTEWQMLTSAYGILATGFLLLPFASNSYVHASIGFFLGFAAGAGQPNILSLIYRAMPPEKAGEGAGLRSAMGNTMGLTAPSAFGAISGLFGAVPVFIGVGGIACVAAWQSRLGGLRSKAAQAS